MTEDQQLMWNMLTADPNRLAHMFGQELLDLSKIRGRRRFKQRSDEVLNYIMTNVRDPINVISIVKTWLTVYQLPLEPDSMPSFDRFHENYGSWVAENADDISVYSKFEVVL